MVAKIAKGNWQRPWRRHPGKRKALQWLPTNDQDDIPDRRAFASDLQRRQIFFCKDQSAKNLNKKKNLEKK